MASPASKHGPTTKAVQVRAGSPRHRTILSCVESTLLGARGGVRGCGERSARRRSTVVAVILNPAQGNLLRFFGTPAGAKTAVPGGSAGVTSTEAPRSPARRATEAEAEGRSPVEREAAAPAVAAHPTAKRLEFAVPEPASSATPAHPSEVSKVRRNEGGPGSSWSERGALKGDRIVVDSPVAFKPATRPHRCVRPALPAGFHLVAERCLADGSGCDE